MMSEENNNKIEEQDLENPTSEKEEQVSEEPKDQEEAEISPEDLIEKLNEEITSLKDQRLRAIAELENFRKRAEKDQSDALKYGISNFAKEIINIRDLNSKSQPVSDVFSAGIIMHILLFGVSVFPGKRYNDVLAQNRACEFSFESDIYKASENKLQLKLAMEVMKKMLAIDPKKRIRANEALSY